MKTHYLLISFLTGSNSNAERKLQIVLGIDQSSSNIPCSRQTRKLAVKGVDVPNMKMYLKTRAWIELCTRHSLPLGNSSNIVHGTKYMNVDRVK